MIVSTIDHYRSKLLLSLWIVLTFEKKIVIDSKKTCKTVYKLPKMDKKVQVVIGRVFVSLSSS